MEVDRRADGPRVRFGTFNHRSDGLPSILRCQGGWGACIHRRCPLPPPQPTFTEVDPGCSFTQFEMLTVEDVADAICALPDKQCSSDPIATRYVKEAVGVLVPFCTELFNRSLTTGSVPSSFKAAYVTPFLKKVSLDPADVSSYRPISNLPVMSKLLERLVAKQLVGYLTASGLLPRLQSAFCAHHSTETAVLRVMTVILRALDTGNLAVLTLLDL